MPFVSVFDFKAPIAVLTRPGLPDPMFRLAYIQAARRFCELSGFLTTNIPGSTALNTQLYDLGDDVYTEIIGIAGARIEFGASDAPALTEKPSTQWDATEPAGRPKFYQYVPMAQIAIHPTPSQAWPMTVGAAIRPKMGAVQIDARLPMQHEQALQDGALSILLAMNDQPWADPREAAVRKGLFTLACHSASHAASRGHNPHAEPTEGLTEQATGATRARPRTPF